MEVVIFDVGNASCNYICSPSKYAMMIDCGSSSNKQNPVDFINYFNKGSGDLFKSKPYVTSGGRSYPLALLHITHPDNDHVRNAERIHRELTPYLLCHTYTENFDDASTIDGTYKKKLDKVYRGDNPEPIDWGFDVDTTFSIPIETVKSEPTLKGKVRNNSSIIRYIKYNGVSFLFAGDLETAGWEWLSKNDSHFRVLMRRGIDVLVAPHHGHDSGFPKALLNLTGKVKVIILSKDTEASKEGSDVYSGYSNYANGVGYYNASDESTYFGKVLTTRSNGNIYVIIDSNGLYVAADKASSNHKRLQEL